MTIPNTTPQPDFDREKHLSIGRALKEQRSKDIDASIAEVKAAEDNFRGLSVVEQQEFLSNQGIEAETKHLVRRTGNEDKKDNIVPQATSDTTGAKPKIIQGT